MVTAVPLDVTVVVPVYNAAVNLDGCVRSLLAQTLAPDRYEILLVDDGSTDGTGTDVDAWVTAYPERVRAIHQPNSGWPGYPRNVGVEHARGDYVLFVDNDDTISPRALERIVAAARRSDADVVVPKSASDFRAVNHDVYRSNRERLTSFAPPLVESLVPHKLVRRAFVQEHGIRFPDSPRHLEDQLFFAHAYAHAQSVAIVADEVCYHYRRRRGFGRNLGDIPADPDDYYRDLEGVLDVVDRHVPDEEARLRVYERFYRVEMLGRLRDRAMLDYDDAYRRRLFHRVRRLVEERLPLALDDLLPSLVRVQARLVRDHDLPALLRYAEELATLRLGAHVAAARWVDGALHVDVRATVSWQDEPLTGERLRAMTGLGLAASDVADVVVVGREDAATWFVPPGLDLVDDAGLRIEATVVLDPRTLLAGSVVTPGLWDVRLRMRLGGMTRTARLAPEAEAPAVPVCLFDTEPQLVEPYWTSTGGLALDVGGWSHSLTDRVAADAVRDEHAWMVPSVVSTRSTRRDAQLFVRRADGTQTTHQAALRSTPTGSTLAAHRSRSAGVGDEVWVRVGAPGGNAPARLS